MPIKLAVNFILDTIPTGIVSLVALSLGVYGIILVTRASLAQPKTRSWFGLSLMTVSIVINVIFFLLLQFHEFCVKYCSARDSRLRYVRR